MKNILSHKLKLVPFCLITMSSLLLSGCSSEQTNFSFVEELKAPSNSENASNEEVSKSTSEVNGNGNITVIEGSGRQYELRQTTSNAFENVSTGKVLNKVKKGELLGTTVFSEMPYGLLLGSIFIDISDPEILKNNIEEFLLSEVNEETLSLESLQEVTKKYRSSLYETSVTSDGLDEKLLMSKNFQASLLEGSDLKVKTTYINDDLKSLKLEGGTVNVNLTW